jgi:uncharacterized membrane protein
MIELCHIVSITLGVADSGHLYNTMSIRMAMMKPVTEQDVTSGMAVSRMTASGMAVSGMVVSMMATRRLTMTGMVSKFMSDQQRRDNLNGVEEEEKGVLPKWS